MSEKEPEGTCGFTLLELMTVISIIGVLSAIAVPAFFKYIHKAKTVEAVSNLSTITMLEQAFKLDHGHYLSCKRNPLVSPCEAAKKAKSITRWSRQKEWEKLGFRPYGQLYYRYQVKLTPKGFIAEAIGDLDCDGSTSRYWQTQGMSAPGVKDEIE